MPGAVKIEHFQAYLTVQDKMKLALPYHYETVKSDSIFPPMRVIFCFPKNSSQNSSPPLFWLHLDHEKLSIFHP